MKTELWAIGLVLFATSLGSFGPLFLKKASGKISLNVKSLLMNRNLLIGLFFYAISTILFIPALKGGELSVLYPFVALVYVWVSLLSMKFLGERMSRMKWFGVLLILVGVSLIGLGS
jgi:drug/metabolite transporter (DMT)-like permease